MKVLLILCLLCSPLWAGEALLPQYQTPVPFTFGMFFDLSIKLYAAQLSDERARVEVFITRSGKLQMKVDVRQRYLPQVKKEAETWIEDYSRKLHDQMQKYANQIWKSFPELVSGEPYVSASDYLKTFVSLDGTMIGYSDGLKFLWRGRERDIRPVVNAW